VVLIDSEFTGIGELDEVYGARFIPLDDINTFKTTRTTGDYLQIQTIA